MRYLFRFHTCLRRRNCSTNATVPPLRALNASSLTRANRPKTRNLHQIINTAIFREIAGLPAINLHPRRTWNEKKLTSKTTRNTTWTELRTDVDARRDWTESLNYWNARFESRESRQLHAATRKRKLFRHSYSEKYQRSQSRSIILRWYIVCRLINLPSPILLMRATLIINNWSTIKDANICNARTRELRNGQNISIRIAYSIWAYYRKTMSNNSRSHRLISTPRNFKARL